MHFCAQHIIFYNLKCKIGMFLNMSPFIIKYSELPWLTKIVLTKVISLRCVLSLMCQHNTREKIHMHSEAPSLCKKYALFQKCFITFFCVIPNISTQEKTQIYILSFDIHRQADFVRKY